MAKQPSGLKAFGSKAVSVIASGALALSLTPAIALANTGDLQAQSMSLQTQSSMKSDTGLKLATVKQIGNSYDLQWDDGAWKDAAGVVNADGSRTYVYQTYVKGDNAHYGHYDMDISFTVKDNVLVGVDMTSEGTVFGGKWCTLTPHSGTYLVGLLPDGVTSSASLGTTTVDGSEVPQITGIELKGAGKAPTTIGSGYKAKTSYDAEAVGGYGGYSISSINLYKVDANGNIATEKVLDPSDGDYDDVKVGYAVDLTKDVNDDTVVWDSTAKSLTVKKASRYNVASIAYKIGDYYVFEERFALDTTDKAANDYASAVTDVAGASVSGIGSKNRDTYSGAAFGIIMQNELPSWIKSVDSLLAYFGGNSSAQLPEDELTDIDIVSAATKTSDGIIEALYASQGMEYRLSNYDDVSAPTVSGAKRLFTSVSDNLALTIDGKAMSGDGTYVTKDASGNLVLHSALFNDVDKSTLSGAAADVPVAGFDLYRTSDNLSAADKWDLTKVGNIYSTHTEEVAGRNGAMTTAEVDDNPLAYVAGVPNAKKDYTDGGTRTSYRTKTALAHNIIGEFGGANSKGENLDATSDTYMSYDPATKQLTVKDPSVRYVAVQFGVGKLGSGSTNTVLNTGVCGVVYDLQDASLVKQSTQTIDVAKSYDKKTTDAKFPLNAKAQTDLKYTSNNAKVATVDASGNVTLVGAGTAKITVSTDGDAYYQKASKTVTVNVARATQSVSGKASASKTLKANKKTKKVAGKKSVLTLTNKGKSTTTYSVTKWTTKAAKNYFSVASKTGKVTTKKATPKGTYKFTVTATAAKTAKYAKATKNIAVTVTVK